MKRAATIGFVVVVCMCLSIFSLIESSSAIDLDEKGKLTLDELTAGAKKEGKLVFYSAHPIYTIQDLFKIFCETYPFVKTDFIRAGGLVVAQRFYAEKSRKINKVDVIYSGAAEIYPDWKKKGYLSRVDNLPEYSNIEELAKGHGDRYIMFAFATHVMVWNRKVYKDEEVPADLWEFTKPKWKNKTASGDPATAGFALNWFSFASDARHKDPRSAGKPSGLGFEWMRAMYKNGHLLAGQIGNTTETVVSGRRPILVHHFDKEVWKANKRGAELGWRYPIQGPMAQHCIAGINSEAPHPYTARLFLNWLLSKEGQKASVKLGGYNTVRKDMKTSDFIKGRKSISECWTLDIERITAEETRDFIRKCSNALRGR